jgi:hypothetical protein
METPYMSITLQVETTVTALDSSGHPITPAVYDSKYQIMADTSSNIQITVPGKATNGYEVYVEAGQQTWLRFFAITPTNADETLPKGLSFATADSQNQTASVGLSGPVAYSSPDALAPLFEGITELQKVSFINPGACDVDLTIYFIRDVAKKAPPDPCPKKS